MSPRLSVSEQFGENHCWIWLVRQTVSSLGGWSPSQPGGPTKKSGESSGKFRVGLAGIFHTNSEAGLENENLWKKYSIWNVDQEQDESHVLEVFWRQNTA